MELDPRYVDVIVRRWQEWTGKSATRLIDGVAFDGLAADGIGGLEAHVGVGDEETDEPNR